MKKVLKIFFLILFVILLLIIVISSWRYYSWKSMFESDIVMNNLVEIPSERSEELSKKIAIFALSDMDNEYLELTPYEFALLISEISTSYPIKQVYIDPGLGIWTVYAKIEYLNIPIWLSLDLNKDNMQTAQLYVTDVYLGPYPIGNIFNITEQINTGIADALLTVNENGFSGRYFENIELLEDKIVVKGSKY